MESLNVLQKSYLLVPISIILALAITFIFNLVTKNENSYTNAITISAIVSGLIVNIHNLSPIVENIMTDLPPF